VTPWLLFLHTLCSATINSGFGGWIWAPEVRDATSPSEFARRSQLMLFSGISSMDGWSSGFQPYPPFVSPASAVIFKQYYDARTALIPTLYSAYQEQSVSGLPVVRSLVVDYPADAAALAKVQDEYLLASLLVAPAGVNATSRAVYFPAGSGDWVDYWNPGTSPTYHGGDTATVAAPDDVLPVFQQVGSVVATEAGKLLTLSVVLHPGRETAGSFRVYDDDGRTTRHRTHGEYSSWHAHALIRNDGTTSSSSPTLTLSFTPQHYQWRPRWDAVQWRVIVAQGQAVELRCTGISIESTAGGVSVLDVREIGSASVSASCSFLV
jgi:alpha-glucosidase (family GH31 glycosyl hydrolase)